MLQVQPFTVLLLLTTPVGGAAAAPSAGMAAPSAGVAALSVGMAAASSAAPAGAPAPADTISWHRLEGLWDLDDGRTLVSTDLTDQMPENAHQLMVLEPESGWVRTLHAVSDTLPEFAIGAGFFQAEPQEGNLAFGVGPDARGDSLVWRPAGGGTLVGRRSLVREREIRFESGGIELAGALLLPPDSVEPPYPALLFVHGSGPLTRRSPRQVGYQMAAAGVAAIVFDKRGTGESGGTYRQNAIEDGVRDAVAALDFARSLPELDPARIGIHAASEGGYVAPSVLEARPDVAALVCRVCPVLPWADALPYRLRAQLEAEGFPEAEIREAVEYVGTQARFALERDPRIHRELVARYEDAEGADWLGALGLRRPAPPDARSWDAFQEFLSPDPTGMYAGVSMPVLVALGEADPRLPGAVHGAHARELLEGAPSSAWDVWVLPGANHGLMMVREGPDGENLAPTRYAPELHPRLVEWVRQHLGAPDSR